MYRVFGNHEAFLAIESERAPVSNRWLLFFARVESIETHHRKIVRHIVMVLGYISLICSSKGGLVVKFSVRGASIYYLVILLTAPLS